MFRSYTLHRNLDINPDWENSNNPYIPDYDDKSGLNKINTNEMKKKNFVCKI